MIEALLAILIVACCLLLLYWLVTRFPLPAPANQVLGVIFAIILVIYALHRFGLLNSIRI